MKKSEYFGVAARKKVLDLEQLKVDSINWWIFYLDNNTGEKWKEDRPE